MGDGRGDDELRAAYRAPGTAWLRTTANRDHELAYFPAATRGPLEGLFYGAVAAVGAFVVVAGASGSARWGLLAAAVVAVGWHWLGRRRKVTPRASFLIDGPRLELSGSAFGEPRHLQLEDVLDVYLDTDTVVELSGSPGSSVEGAGDTARIALKLASETLFLTDKRGSYFDAHEWFGKIRRFLRRHGWAPQDER